MCTGTLCHVDRLPIIGQPHELPRATPASTDGSADVSVELSRSRAELAELSLQIAELKRQKVQRAHTPSLP